MIAAVEGLIAELRRIGVPVSVSESIDAMATLRHADLASRDELKAALGATLIKDAGHEAAFAAVFDLFFSLRPDGTGQPGPAGRESGQPNGLAAAPGGASGAGGGMLDSLDDAGIRSLLLTALGAGDQTMLRALAALLVSRYAGMQPGRAVAGTYYMFRVMRAIDPADLLTRLMPGPGSPGEGPPPEAEADAAGAAGELDELGRRLLADEYQRRLTSLEQEIEAEIRRRLVADRGAEAVARTLRKPLPEDADFLTASAVQVAELRSIVQPLARKLAARLALKRRTHRQGSLDFRRTMRACLSTGGAPVVPVFRRPRPAKPELVVLADISGSVSAFAAFTLQLAYALRSEFSKVRCFVFVDGLDEVTRIFEDAGTVAAAAQQINSEGHGVWLDGRSDYGNALERFWAGYGAELRRRTTVLLLGDARTNYHAPRAETLKRIADRAGHVYWLNPEPRTVWDTGDSVISEYAGLCDGVFECRNVRQLRAFVELLGDRP